MPFNELNEVYWNNLLGAYQDLDIDTKLAGSAFWRQVHGQAWLLAREHKVDIETICGMMATMSPGITLEKAAEFTAGLLCDYAEGKNGHAVTLVGAYGWANLEKCEILFHAGSRSVEGLLSGMKVVAVYHNILTPENTTYVALGKYEKQAVLCDSKMSEKDLTIRTPKEYAGIARHFFFVGSVIGIPASALQASLEIGRAARKAAQVRFASIY